MEKPLLKFIYFPLLLLIILLVEKSKAGSSENDLQKDFKSLVLKEIGLLKHENQNQNLQIERVKEFVGFNKVNSNNENEQKQMTSTPLDDHQGRHKRLYRLLPPNDNTKSPKMETFYGPPTNCSELNQLGHTLNGYYQVKSANIPDINQLETVYCLFKQPEGIFNSFVTEKRISSSSHLQFPKSGPVGTGVHFYVLLNSFTDTTYGGVTIKFDDVKLNFGEAYDSKSGIFKAPKSGVYSFLFMGYISSGNFAVAAIHRNDNEPVGVAIKMFPGNTPRDPVIRTIVELKRGDTIQVKWGAPRGSHLSLLSFSGSLLQ